MTRRRKKIRSFIQRVHLILIWMTGVLFRSISRRKSTAIAHFIGDFAFHILRIRRKLVSENLARTFPGKNASEIRAIAHLVYRNQAENVIEVFRLPMIKSAEDAARLMDIDARDIVTRAIDRKKGVVMVSAHFGNWELLSLCSGLLIAPMAMVIKKLKNPAINRQINSWRTMHGNRIVNKHKALREGLRTLHNGGILAMLGDQSDPNEGFFTEFLGRRTSVFLGPAYLALKAGVPLFIVMCRRTGDGRYKVEIKEIDMHGLGTAKADAEELVRRYTKVLERYIYCYPEEWFWLHNRWKRQVDGIL